jgi:hypothetical protein
LEEDLRYEERLQGRLGSATNSLYKPEVLRNSHSVIPIDDVVRPTTSKRIYYVWLLAVE